VFLQRADGFFGRVFLEILSVSAGAVGGGGGGGSCVDNARSAAHLKYAEIRF